MKNHMEDALVGLSMDDGMSKSAETRLQLHAYANCVPLNVTFEITLKCNIKCEHCYNFDRAVPYDRQKQAKELTDDEIFTAIDQLGEAGCLYLAFSGGEAMVHPRIFDFVAHARKRNMLARVKSNGTLFTSENVRKLMEVKTTGVDVSIYGGSPETHDPFVRVPGSFDKTFDGARTAKELGLPVRFTYCLTKKNIHELPIMREKADELGIAYTLDPSITARYDGTTDSLDLRLDRDTLKELYSGPLRSMLPAPDCNPDRSVQCSCARSVCGISCTGDVYPCIAAPIPCGNLREKPFKEIWTGSEEMNKIRALRLDDFEVCKPCPDRPYCQRSSGPIYVNTGIYTGPDEWTCMQASVVHEIYNDEQAEAMNALKSQFSKSPKN